MITGYDGIVADELPMGTPLFREYTIEVDIPKVDGATKDFQAEIQKKPAASGK